MKMVDISKLYESNYVTVEMLKALGKEERIGIIVGVGEVIKTKFGDLWQLPVQLGKEIKPVTLFHRSYELCKNEWGSDTNNWLSKKISLDIEVNTKGTEVVVVKPISI